jgi:peptidyl-prolyl cis-trans isomerase A (cyclophilin A)
MRKVWFASIVLGMCAVYGCKPNSSEAPPEGESAEEKSSAPAAVQPKAAVEKASAANPERTEDGYEVIRAKTKDGQEAALEVKAPAGWKVVQPPTTPDPRGGKFGLKDATKDLGGKGPLVATIRTNLGTLYCDLYEDKAPNTVANFVGLARGLREIWDGQAWVAKPYYDGTTFHRVIPGFMIQGGDFKGDGSGEIWYTIPDEVHPSLKHDKSGQLCMANRGPNTNAAQFFITEGAAPHLDGSYSIFGQCIPNEIVNRIARVPQSGAPNNRPLTPVVMEKVSIERRVGGANAAAAGGAAASTPGPSAPAADKPKPEAAKPEATKAEPGVVPPGKAVRVDAPAETPKTTEPK